MLLQMSPGIMKSLKQIEANEDLAKQLDLVKEFAPFSIVVTNHLKLASQFPDLSGGDRKIFIRGIPIKKMLISR